MSDLLAGLLSALLATNPPVAVSNLVKEKTGASVEFVNANDPVEKEYQKLLADDDAAQAEVDDWLTHSQAFAEKGAADVTPMNVRIKRRFAPIKAAYEDFLRRNPNHARARIAYGSFLNDTKDEDGAVEQWEQARQLDPKNPAPWNNLANAYGHHGPVKKAFEYYAKAIELDAHESVYFQNFAVTVYLFRKDAMEYYKISEKEVFDKALDLYRKAMKLDPTNFPLASDYAQSFYGTKPPRLEDGLVAWQDALKIARDDIEREGVYIHFARIKWKLGRLDEAQKDLDVVTNQMYASTKKTLQRNINQARTNAPPATVK